MKCPKCKNILTKSAKFCHECGAAAPVPVPVKQEPTSSGLTVKQAAKYMKCSRDKLYRLINTQGLPYYEFGARKRFLPSELDEWEKSRQIRKAVTA